MIFCQEIKDKQLWDRFVTSQPNHTFLHSWAWGEFNEAMGEKVWRVGIFESTHACPPLGRGRPMPALRSFSEGGVGPSPAAVAQVIKVHAKRGNFLFIPHGPLLRSCGASEGQAILETLIITLKALAKQEKVSFIRISPILENTSENRELLKQLGFRPAPIHMHAETTWTLDLSPTEDELFMDMRKTTRNLIRRAIKEGVTIKTGSSEQDVEIFYNLYQETVKKHRFTPFSLTFLKKQVRIVKDTRVFTAYYQGQPLASAVIVFYGNSAFYHHGASVPSKIPAAYLLQWEAIREAKRRGHRFYNFWGVIKEDAPQKHPWQGITLFKKGFGGFQTDYMHAQDLPLNRRYWVNWMVEAVRRRKRNL